MKVWSPVRLSGFVIAKSAKKLENKLSILADEMNS